MIHMKQASNRYKCKVCGYIYRQEIGEARTNTPAGTEFESLEDTWSCPKCGAGKRNFIKMP